jgi:hypothetical protein
MGKMTASLQGPETAKTIDALVTPALLVDEGRAEHTKKLGVLRRKIEAGWQRIRGRQPISTLCMAPMQINALVAK